MNPSPTIIREVVISGGVVGQSNEVETEKECPYDDVSRATQGIANVTARKDHEDRNYPQYGEGKGFTFCNLTNLK